MQEKDLDRDFMIGGFIGGSLLIAIGVCLAIYLILTPIEVMWAPVMIVVAAVALCCGTVIIGVRLLMLFEAVKANFIGAIVQAQAAGLQYESVEVKRTEEEFAKELKKPCKPSAIEVFSVDREGTLLVATRDMWYFLREYPAPPQDEIVARRLPRGPASLKKPAEA
ncbi:MAG TPA: hypothetical protein VHC21_03985 [Candidatus Saccharimonadales bacterium]|nr:hypothetical protein [Candidatus Saccharimonadales bacterium]